MARKPQHRAIGLLLVVVVGVSASAQQLDDAVRDTPRASSVSDVVLGFRTDIPPFSFEPPSLNGAGTSEEEPRPYLGYVADLCYKIFNKSDFEVGQEPVTAKDRFCRIRGFEPTGDVCKDFEDKPKVDVLCGATTLRLDDERMAAGVFSPIVFVSGVSYVSRRGRDFAKFEIGYVSGSTAERVAEEICSLDVLSRSPRPGKVECDKTAARAQPGSSGESAVERLSNESPEETKEDDDPRPTPSLEELAEEVPRYSLAPKDDHQQLVEWFCASGNENGRIYVGDRDIILGKINDWKAQGNECEKIRDSGQSFTYEPYALLTSKADSEIISFVQQRIYQIFSHRAGAEALFYKWFPGQQMSDPLAWQFLLNGVMEQNMLLSGEQTIE